MKGTTHQNQPLLHVSTKEYRMKHMYPLILSAGFLLLGSCANYNSGRSAPASEVLSRKPLAMPIGKNWQVIEEPAQLSDDRGRLPFQTEQSLQPEGAKPVSPEDKRKIDVSR